MGTVKLAGAKQGGEEVLQQRCRRWCQLAEMARKSGGFQLRRPSWSCSDNGMMAPDSVAEGLHTGACNTKWEIAHTFLHIIVCVCVCSLKMSSWAAAAKPNCVSVCAYFNDGEKSNCPHFFEVGVENMQKQKLTEKCWSAIMPALISVCMSANMTPGQEYFSTCIFMHSYLVKSC